MDRPFRRFCFNLAKELGKSVSEVMTWDTPEIMEWAAYLKTTDETWLKTYNEQKELEEQQELSPEAKAAKMRALFTKG